MQHNLGRSRGAEVDDRPSFDRLKGLCSVTYEKESMIGALEEDDLHFLSGIGAAVHFIELLLV